MDAAFPMVAESEEGANGEGAAKATFSAGVRDKLARASGHTLLFGHPGANISV